jgi:hypothetical protein
MDISGTWYNELNSTMELAVNGKQLSGRYTSAVGQAQGPYELTGYLDVDDATPTLGWVVVWKNAKAHAPSVTAWSGQAQTVLGEQLIDTTWLLTRSTAVQEEWESTMIGKDVFRRTKATAEEVERARTLRGVRLP